VPALGAVVGAATQAVGGEAVPAGARRSQTRHRAGGLPWWQAIPLGLVERGLALTQIIALSLLAVAVLQRRDPVLERPARADASTHADVDAVRP